VAPLLGGGWLKLESAGTLGVQLVCWSMVLDVVAGVVCWRFVLEHCAEELVPRPARWRACCLHVVIAIVECCMLLFGRGGV